MPCDHAYAPHPGETIINAKIHSTDCGKCLMTTQEHAFSDKAECEICGLIKFDNNDSKNSELIDFWQAESTSPRTVALTGRSFPIDDCWNTVCLPFSVMLEDSPFANVTLKELDASQSYLTDGTLTLNFNDATSIEAGKPYLLKANPDFIINTSDAISDPVFRNVIINNIHSDVTISDETATFHGIFDPLEITGEDRSILYLGANNKLYYPSNAMTIGAFRAYFQLNGITVGDPTQGESLNAILLNFPDENATGIEDVKGNNGIKEVSDDNWFTPDGRKLNGKPNVKGIYIHNGRKIVIK